MIKIFTLANVDPFPSDWMVIVWVLLWRIWSMSSSQNLEPSSSSSIRAPYAPFFNKSSISNLESCCTCVKQKPIKFYILTVENIKRKSIQVYINITTNNFTKYKCDISPHWGFLCGWCPEGRLCPIPISDWPCQTFLSRMSSWWSICRLSLLCSGQSGDSVPEPNRRDMAVY